MHRAATEFHDPDMRYLLGGAPPTVALGSWNADLPLVDQGLMVNGVGNGDDGHTRDPNPTSI